jgi:neutral ceramidase
MLGIVRWMAVGWMAVGWFAIWLSGGIAAGAEFKVGFAKRDITPAAAMPMWGYGARHAALSQGVRDPLFAKAVVIDTGSQKLAIVGLDLGRSPTDAMLVRIRAAIQEQAGVGLTLISGSHTHHGPVIELLDEVGKGRGVFDDAVAYAQELEAKLIEVIVAAAADVQPARIGWGSKPVAMNRNRHTKVEPKPTDPELGVIRFDTLDGQPLALVVNYAAHATMLDAADLRFSAEWPGQMMQAVEERLQTNCLFMQGAAGDLSPNPPAGVRGIEAFGQALAEQVLEVAGAIESQVPARPRLQAKEQVFEYATRLPMGNPLTTLMFSQAFFPELAAASTTDDLQQSQIHPRLTVVLINRELALVGGSGEFFCQHSVRLKERSRAAKTFFFGYCNGHHMYFPTIEGAAEGGYGADPAVSWVSVGAGEEMMNQALITLYSMLGKFSSLPF